MKVSFSANTSFLRRVISLHSFACLLWQKQAFPDIGKILTLLDEGDNIAPTLTAPI